MSFSFVVAIDALKGFVQLGDERPEVFGFFFKFHEPLVCPISLVPEIYRGGSIIVDNGACLLAGDRDGFIGVVDDDLFAEGIDEMFESSAYLDTEWIAGSKLYS